MIRLLLTIQIPDMSTIQIVTVFTTYFILCHCSQDREKTIEQEPVKPEVSKEEVSADAVPEEEEEEVASGGGWGGWTSSWIDTGSASALLGKAMSSVNAAVEVAKTKVILNNRQDLNNGQFCMPKYSPVVLFLLYFCIFPFRE